jgi:hypothetical protein
MDSGLVDPSVHYNYIPVRGSPVEKEKHLVAIMYEASQFVQPRSEVANQKDTKKCGEGNST